MHVISYRRLREFTNKHALENWHKIASQAIWYNLVEVQTVEYDKEQWKNDPYF